jgi:putative transposase
MSQSRVRTVLHDNDIEHTLCKVGRPQSNGKIEWFFQTYEKHRQRFGTLDEFLTSTTRSDRT